MGGGEGEDWVACREREQQTAKVSSLCPRGRPAQSRPVTMPELRNGDCCNSSRLYMTAATSEMQPSACRLRQSCTRTCQVRSVHPLRLARGPPDPTRPSPPERAKSPHQDPSMLSSCTTVSLRSRVHTFAVGWPAAGHDLPLSSPSAPRPPSSSSLSGTHTMCSVLSLNSLPPSLCHVLCSSDRMMMRPTQPAPRACSGGRGRRRAVRLGARGERWPVTTPAGGGWGVISWVAHPCESERR